MLVVGASVFPYYPYIPGPSLPEGAALVAITSDPDEAARAPMGDAIVADVGLTLAALLRARSARRDREAPPERAGPPDPARTPTRSSGTAAMHGARRRLPRRTAIVVLESPSSTLALRNQLRLSTPGSYYFGAGGGLGFGLAAASACSSPSPTGPVVCVLGEGSAQYAITGFWTAVAYDVPVTFLVLRNDEYAILKWFSRAERSRARRGSTCRRSTSARRRRLRRPTTTSVDDARSCARRSRGLRLGRAPSSSRSASRPACGSA